jgi:hypothetical protein
MPYSREQELQVQASSRIHQARYDEALQPWGMRAPERILGEPIDDYRRRLAIKAKRLLPEDHELRQVQFKALDNDVLDNFEPQLLKDCMSAAYRADSVPLGTMRRVEKVDQNGLKTVEWIGQRSFVEDFKQIPRRVLGFLDPGSGRYRNTNGRYL